MRLSTESIDTPPRRRLTAQARRALIEHRASELFAAHGYAGTTIEAIAARSGVSAPVVYDHFTSKLDLYRRLLERHFAELRELWREQLKDAESPEQSIPRAFDAWFAYVEEHPFAWRMLFRDTTGVPDAQAAHAEVVAQSRDAITPLFLEQLGVRELPDASADVAMAWVAMRSVLQGLALWWYEHQHVPRAQVVAAAMNALWVGFERARAGEAWQPPPAGPERSRGARTSAPAEAGLDERAR